MVEIEIPQFHPRLKIVGTCHGLNSRDKDVIDGLVAESSFVGLEWDDVRDHPKDYFHFSPFKRLDLRGDHLYGSLFDNLIYPQIKFKNHRRIKKVKGGSGRDCDPLSVDRNEFLYTRELCLKKGISVYCVDDPVTHIIYRALVNVYSNESIDFDRSGRSQRMLSRLILNTGELDSLNRGGILMVGAGHLEDYQVMEVSLFQKDVVSVSPPKIAF